MSRHPIPSDAPPSVSAETLPAEHWQLRAAKKAATHDHLGAYNAAVRALSLSPDSTLHKHKALSALADAGDSGQARRILAEIELPICELADDTIALKARLGFERALVARGDERAFHAKSAAELYENIHSRTAGIFSAIRASMMWLLAGDTDRASLLSRQVLLIGERERPASPEEAYYVAAAEAQAALVLADIPRAQKRLRTVRFLSGDDHAQSAWLRKCSLLICEARHLPADILSVLIPPPIIVYSGCQSQRIGFQSSIEIGEEIRIIGEIANYLRSHGTGYGYGSLSCGPDILVAEQLLSSGSRLCIVLPVPAPLFLERVLKPEGPDWRGRFESCLGAAARLVVVDEEANAPSPDLWQQAEKAAMGLALLHAQTLDTGIERLAIGAEPQRAGDCLENSIEFKCSPGISLWNKRGLPTFRIDAKPISESPKNAPSPVPASMKDVTRAVRAMLFGEITGASSLQESGTQGRAAHIIEKIGHILDEYGSEILFRGAWAERFGIVFSSAAIAARAALALQKAMEANAVSVPGHPKELGLRLCAHLAPVFQGANPITKQPAFFGSHIDRMAKPDIIFPSGPIYASEPFAAALMLESGEFQCDPVGKAAPQGKLEAISMYVLKPKE